MLEMNCSGRQLPVKPFFSGRVQYPLPLRFLIPRFLGCCVGDGGLGLERCVQLQSGSITPSGTGRDWSKT